MSDLSVPRAAARVAALTAMLLLAPLVAMQFFAEPNWAPGDFVAAGVLLFSAGMAYVLATRRVRTTRQKVVPGIRGAGRRLGRPGRRAVPLKVWNGKASHCAARHLTPVSLAP